LEVNAAKPFDERFVFEALLREILREPVWQVRVPHVNVHMTEQVVIHVVAVRIRVGWKEADVFVEVEGAAQREVEVLVLVHSREVSIDALHRGAGCEAEHEMGIEPELPGDHASDQGSGCFRIRLNNNFHGEYCYSECGYLAAKLCEKLTKRRSLLP